MTKLHTALPALSVVLAALATTSAATAANSADQATAEALFQTAKGLAAAGDVAGACPKFAESQRLDPASGTALNLADCWEKLGKYASAWSAFKDAEAMARNQGNKEREAEAGRRAVALAPRLPKLTLVVPPSARVPGFEVSRDGSVVGEAQWGSPIPVDAGEHVIGASAPGRLAWTKRVTIAGPNATTVAVEPLAEDPSAKPLPFWTGRRVAGVVVGGVGVAGVIVGGVLGGLAISKNNASKADCSPQDPNFCNNAGASLRSNAITFGNSSTVAIVVGGAALATGIVLVALPVKADTSVEVLPGAGSFTLRGRF